MFRKIPKHILIPLVTLVTGLFFGSALQIALAWTVPSATPPGNNVAPPLNTSAVDQTKIGSLTVSGNGMNKYMQAPRFIDNDNTNFFLDPNSSSKLSFATFDNLESLGFVSANRMVTSAYMQAPVFYDNNNINYKLDPNSWSVVSAIYADSQIYSPVLYDTNNANYYVDPAGYSRLNYPITDFIYNYGSIYSVDDICTATGGGKCLSQALTQANFRCTCYVYTLWENVSGGGSSYLNTTVKACPGEPNYTMDVEWGTLITNWWGTYLQPYNFPCN